LPFDSRLDAFVIESLTQSGGDYSSRRCHKFSSVIRH
jgi:hypothetical protein